MSKKEKEILRLYKIVNALMDIEERLQLNTYEREWIRQQIEKTIVEIEDLKGD